MPILYTIIHPGICPASYMYMYIKDLYAQLYTIHSYVMRLTCGRGHHYILRCMHKRIILRTVHHTTSLTLPTLLPKEAPRQKIRHVPQLHCGPGMRLQQVQLSQNTTGK